MCQFWLFLRGGSRINWTIWFGNKIFTRGYSLTDFCYELARHHNILSAFYVAWLPEWIKRQTGDTILAFSVGTAALGIFTSYNTFGGRYTGSIWPFLWGGSQRILPLFASINNWPFPQWGGSLFIYIQRGFLERGGVSRFSWPFLWGGSQEHSVTRFLAGQLGHSDDLSFWSCNLRCGFHTLQLCPLVLRSGNY